MRSFLSLSIAAALAGGCIADSAQNSSLVLLKNQPPNADCTVAGNDTGAFVGSGIMDISQTDIYVMTPLVELRIQAFNSDDRLQRSVTVQGAEIDLGDGAFSKRFSIVMEPNSTIGASFQLIDPNTAVADGETIFATVKIFGETGGSDIESNEFEYPIDICDGCLKRGVATPCREFQAPTEESCFPGQDSFTVECCTDSTGAEQCPGFVEVIP